MKLAQLGVQTDGLGTEMDAREIAARVHAAARSREETFVFFVDQFEEAFTLARDRGERAVFCSWLVAIAGSRADPARLVLTLRDDFLTKVQQESAFRDRLEHALAFLATPGAADLRRILVEPARRAGFAFESDALVGEMVRAVEGRPGALALLSFAASKLWEQRDPESRMLTRSAYESMGGVAGALAQHGEGLLASPSDFALYQSSESIDSNPVRRCRGWRNDVDAFAKIACTRPEPSSPRVQRVSGRFTGLPGRAHPTKRPDSSSGRRDSNPRHQAWEACTLPTELLPQRPAGLPREDPRVNEPCRGPSSHAQKATVRVCVAAPGPSVHGPNRMGT